jgi:hypothetical protein
MPFKSNEISAPTVTDAVIGDGLVLVPGDHGDLSLYDVAGSRAQSLGTFADVRDAWAALDALDAVV